MIDSLLAIQGRIAVQVNWHGNTSNDEVAGEGFLPPKIVCIFTASFCQSSASR